MSRRVFGFGWHVIEGWLQRLILQGLLWEISWRQLVWAHVYLKQSFYCMWKSSDEWEKWKRTYRWNSDRKTNSLCSPESWPSDVFSQHSNELQWVNRKGLIASLMTLILNCSWQARDIPFNTEDTCPDCLSTVLHIFGNHLSIFYNHEQVIFWNCNISKKWHLPRSWTEWWWRSWNAPMLMKV